MFRFITAVWSLLLLTAATLTAWSLTRVDETDREQLADLSGRMPLPQPEQAHSDVHCQQRDGVRRDFWIDSKHVAQWSNSACLTANQREHAYVEELKDVRCHLEENANLATIQCDKATFEREQGHGRFESESENSLTIIQAQWDQGNGQVVPIVLCSRYVELWTANGQMVGECVAEGRANIEYDGEWTASADRIQYRRHPDCDEGTSAVVNGLITLMADTPKGCLISHFGGSWIAADLISFDMATQEVTLHHVDGVLCSKRGELRVQADLAYINHADHCLRLKDHVMLSQPGGQELTGHQVTIDYVYEGSEVQPKYCVAEGHVCLKRLSDAGGMQYVLSDTVEYAPQSDALRFHSLPPRRVLFFDRQYDVRVSAPEVHVTRDPVTGQEKIRGIGDLRMTLLDQELAHLRDRFAIEGDKRL